MGSETYTMLDKIIELAKENARLQRDLKDAVQKLTAANKRIVSLESVLTATGRLKNIEGSSSDRN